MTNYRNTTPTDIEDGVDLALADAEAVVAQIVSVDGPRTFENTMRPLDRIADILGHAFTDHAFMGYVHPDKEVRAAAKTAEERMSKWAADIYFRDELDRAIKDYAASEEAATLQGEHQRLLTFVLRDLRRAGHDLDQETRQRVKELTQREIELGVRFQQNIDEWNDWILVSDEDLVGMPQAYIDGLDVDDETGKHKVTIAYPDMIPFLENSPRRDLREELRFKFNTVAVEENRTILEEAVQLRQEIAEAFGLPTWAHHKLELRMAKTPERVKEMYAEVKEPLTAAARDELRSVSLLLEVDTGDTAVQQWDWSYYDTLQRRTDYGVDNFEVARYFPLPSVLEGMFELTSAMFGITFTEIDEFESWHPDVQMFAIHDADTGEEISRFYLDLFPREGKFGHAAEFPLIRGRLLEDGTYQNPLCAMVANFTKPTKDSPSLLQHSEVETLFHEFGHVLHQNLGRTELATFSGTATETDFVEAPSQIMQHWIWRPDVLARFARHSGPDRDIDSIYASGSEITMLPPHEGTFALASFGHIMSGYDASYYGYMWAEVFGDDMFSRFEAEGVTNPEVGMDYRRKVIGRGGAWDADDMLVDFLGREPNNEAFLRKLGISGTG